MEMLQVGIFTQKTSAETLSWLGKCTNQVGEHNATCCFNIVHLRRDVSKNFLLLLAKFHAGVGESQEHLRNLGPKLLTQ